MGAQLTCDSSTGVASLLTALDRGWRYRQAGCKGARCAQFERTRICQLLQQVQHLNR